VVLEAVPEEQQLGVPVELEELVEQQEVLHRQLVEEVLDPQTITTTTLSYPRSSSLQRLLRQCPTQCPSLCSWAAEVAAEVIQW